MAASHSARHVAAALARSREERAPTRALSGHRIHPDARDAAMLWPLVAALGTEATPTRAMPPSNKTQPQRHVTVSHNAERGVVTSELTEDAVRAAASHFS